MQEWLATQAATDFKAFAGTHVAGSIHLSEAFLNELLAKLLAQDASRSAVVAADGGNHVAAMLAQRLTRAAVTVKEGVVIVDLELRV